MDRFAATKKVAVLGIGANLLLLTIKLVAGFTSRSQAMIADGFNSAGDVFASVMTYAGNRIAGKPTDENHPYGHGKAEYVFSMIISFSLLLVAYKVFRGSLDSILNKATFTFSWWLVATAAFTIVLKSCLFIYTRKVGKLHNNLLIIANSEDHRNDLFVTSSTLLGIVLGTMGIYWFDGVVGIGISLWIAFTGVKIFRSSYNILMDTNVSKEFLSKIEEIIKNVAGVDHIDDIVTKPVGVKYIVIAKVSVDGEITVNQGHAIAARIRESVSELDDVEDTVVHINPLQ